MSQHAVELLRRVEETGGRLRVDGADILFVPGEQSTADSLTDALRAHKGEILTLLQSTPPDDLESWRAPFVAWVDENYTLHLKKSSGAGFRNLARHFRAWAESNGWPCSEPVCRVLLEELCFEIRMVHGVEMVQGLVPKSDLEAGQ